MYATSVTITDRADGRNHQLTCSVSNTRPFYKLISEAPTKEAKMKTFVCNCKVSIFKKSDFYHLKGMLTPSKDPFM